MYSAVVFDLDGTLMDSLTDLALASNYALEKLGLPTHEIDAYKYFVGNGIPVLIERIVPQPAEKAVIDKVRPLFMEHYNAHKEDHTGPYDGIIPLLKALKEKQVPVAVATNKDHDIAVDLIKAKFGDLVQFVNGVKDEFPPKPNAKMVEDLIARMGQPKEKTLYVGDTNVDMQTAKNAGLSACAVLWGFRTRAELEAFSPSHIVEKPSEIADLF